MRECRRVLLAPRTSASRKFYQIPNRATDGVVKSFKTLELSLLARDLGALWPWELSEEEDVLA